MRWLRRIAGERPSVKLEAELVLRLQDLHTEADLVQMVGGKASGLARLIHIGLPVPPAVVVPVTQQGVLHDPTAVVQLLGDPLAVRSSGVTEDAGDRSAAGQYESIMGVREATLVAAVRQVYESAYSERVHAYTGSTGVGMTVVIQKEVCASRAGVAFSRNPLTGADEIVVECVFGHGEQLVSGQVQPDRYLISLDDTVRAKLVAKQGPLRRLRTLRDDEARHVAVLVRKAAAGFGCPVDVEFCWEGAKLWLVQCRAITTL